MSSSEINTIKDARLSALISHVASYSSNFKEFNTILVKMCQTTGLPLTELEGLNLESLYTTCKMECDIADKATVLLQSCNCSKEMSPEDCEAFEINETGAAIAKGPNLTILDGGPGSGKSYSLAKAVDVMGRDILCLGATESAGAGLFDDMKKAQKSHEKKRKKGERTPKSVSIFGGLSIDDMFPENKKLSQKRLKDKKGNFIEGSSPDEKKKALLLRLQRHDLPKPCLMVDEVGLLDHKQMQDLLKFSQKYGLKVILAGDCKQIPPEKGQPFKMLVESTRGTPAYTNAAYVNRQSKFEDKVITSGIYNEQAGNKVAISRQPAIEFLEAAYAITDGPSVPPKYGQQTFQEYVNAPKFNDMVGKTPVERYVSYLEQNTETLLKGDPENVKQAIRTGASPENYDAYMCACLVSQQMGIRAYELRGLTNTPDNGKDIYTDVAEAFADPKNGYTASVEKLFNKNRIEACKKAQTHGKTEAEIQEAVAKVKRQYAAGMLAITATEKEAEELNDKIHETIVARNHGKQPDYEPVIIAGSRKLLSQAEISEMKAKKLKIPYAYALDVKTTQGMSQDGKVTFVVRGETMNRMKGGEILVGATRHKGDFEIKMDSEAFKNKELFYKNSVQQLAGARVYGIVNQNVVKAAGGTDFNQRSEAARKEQKEAVKSSVKAQNEQKNLSTVLRIQRMNGNTK